ncbi:MAG: metallophosphoesterase, partial [Candidatus Magasanikbacteria bacterium]|nr:metallophosphoesterase [Candidatus Magasanikbacteria bacterium]
QLIKNIFVVLMLSGILIPQNLKFVAMSDSRGSDVGVNKKILSALVDNMVKTQPDAKFVIFAGDLVDGSKTNPDQTVTELLHWKEVMSPIYSNPNMVWPKIWVVVGNHEVQHPKDEENFRKIFPDVFLNGPSDEKGISYSFDYEKHHFVFVTSDRWYYGNPNDTTDDKRDWHYIKNLDWLENDLKKARKRGVTDIFITSHEPAFPIGGHLRDGLPNLGLKLKLPLDSTRQWYLNQRNEFLRILKDYKVTAYICGHEHLYGRESVDGIYQIVAGSSGAPLYYFNPKYDEPKNPEQEFTYEEAVPYYQTLNYFYGPGENSQASRDFVGVRAFEYVVFDVKKNKVDVTTYGAFPKEKTNDKLGSEIKIIDKFTIRK